MFSELMKLSVKKFQFGFKFLIIFLPLFFNQLEYAEQNMTSA